MFLKYVPKSVMLCWQHLLQLIYLQKYLFGNTYGTPWNRWCCPLFWVFTCEHNTSATPATPQLNFYVYNKKIYSQRFLITKLY